MHNAGRAAFYCNGGGRILLTAVVADATRDGRAGARCGGAEVRGCGIAYVVMFVRSGMGVAIHGDAT